MKNNISKQNNNKRRDIKYTLYVNTIGKKSDKMINEIFYSFPWTRNPKVLKANYGTFRAKKYSLMLEPKDFYTIKNYIFTRAKHVYGSEVHCLIEDKQNFFIIDKIDY